MVLMLQDFFKEISNCLCFLVVMTSNNLALLFPGFAPVGNAQAVTSGICLFID